VVEVVSINLYSVSLAYLLTYEFNVRPMGPCGSDDFSPTLFVTLKPNSPPATTTRTPQPKPVVKPAPMEMEMKKPESNKPCLKPDKTSTPFVV